MKKRNYNDKQQYEHWKIEFYINTNIIEKRAQLPQTSIVYDPFDQQ